MTELQSNNLEYSFGAQKLIGFLAKPKAQAARAGVVLVHDAFGVSDTFASRPSVWPRRVMYGAGSGHLGRWSSVA